ncbi:hypothetical protein TrCOL_g1767 [Triparma columacea]|nr:hypothetical protein TrCOL_g1767 [Triparma columacea]
MSSNPCIVKVGCVGVGSVCEKKSLPGIYKNPSCSVVALGRRDLPSLLSYQSRHNLSSATLFHGPSSGEDLIRHIAELKSLDVASGSSGVHHVVYVATPVSSHAGLVALCGELGLHCYCEKPLSRDLREGEEAARKFRGGDARLWCAYYRRYLPKFEAVKEGINKVGEVTGVRVTLRQKRHMMEEEKKRHWHFKKDVSGGGLVMDLGSHVVDLIDHLLGPLLGVHGVCSRSTSLSPGGPSIEDSVVGTWWHAPLSGGGGPVLGSCELNFAAGEDVDEVRVQGTRGCVGFGVFDDNPGVFRGTGGEEEVLGYEHLGGVQEHVHGRLFEAIVEDLREGKKECFNNAESALRCNEVLDKLLGGRREWGEDKMVK